MSISGDEQGAGEAERAEEQQQGELPAGRVPSIVATSGPVMAIRPRDTGEVARLAAAVVRSGMAPRGWTTDTCMVAIVHGSEVGMPAMAAIQSIAVINGRPTLWGDGALGVVRASGKLEYIRESLREKDMTAVCVVKRKGEPPLTRRFSQEDATLAGLWGKTNKDGSASTWKSYPRRMLQMRARAWALRDGFADVLKGLGIAEEHDIIEGTVNKVVSPAMMEEEPSELASSEQSDDGEIPESLRR